MTYELTDILNPDAFESYPIHSDCGDQAWHLIFPGVGRISILDRETGWGGDGYFPLRDIETGFRDPNGKFWLASCDFDIRREGTGMTYAQAIDHIKAHANNCIPERDEA